jgi:hypothetical protein
MLLQILDHLNSRQPQQILNVDAYKSFRNLVVGAELQLFVYLPCLPVHEFGHQRLLIGILVVQCRISVVCSWVGKFSRIFLFKKKKLAKVCS